MQEISPEPTTPPAVISLSQPVMVVIAGVVLVIGILLFVYLFYKLYQAKVGKIDGMHVHKVAMQSILKKTTQVEDTTQ